MFIYKITNLINGKIYIGQTRGSLEMRLKGHINHKGCTYIHNAIKKYGKENFKIEPICIALDKKYLNELEKVCIKQFNSLVPNGYNISHGGNAPMKDRYHTEESKLKIRNFQLGRKKPRTEQHTKNLSESLKSKKRFGKLHHNSKSIICIELNREFGSIWEAGRELNIYAQNIHKVLNKTRKTCGGYTFRYVEET